MEVKLATEADWGDLALLKACYSLGKGYFCQTYTLGLTCSRRISGLEVKAINKIRKKWTTYIVLTPTYLDMVVLVCNAG